MLAKRILDVALSLTLLPFAVVLSLLTAIAILLLDGRPVLFSQERIGQFDRLFRFYKFRSMSNAVDARGELLPDAVRLTRWGRFLRASSLDELPQLWNVLCGDMSLVGPRPLPVKYLPRYSAFQRRRHEVPPGITGWVQVNGRNALTWQRKFQLDVWYVDHRSFWLDLKILWMTVLKVVRRDGISQEGHATMPEFEGERP
jgi:lipopolysaccharide/colanic/teichoic acid biosynthesis glycosyltransferase